MGNGSMVVVIGICVYAVFILGLGLLKKTDGKNFVNVGGGIGSFALVCSMFISIILVVFIVPYARPANGSHRQWHRPGYQRDHLF